VWYVGYRPKEGRLNLRFRKKVVRFLASAQIKFYHYSIGSYESRNEQHAYKHLVFCRHIVGWRSLSRACKCSANDEVRGLIIILSMSITAMHLRPAAWPIAGASIVLLIVGADNSYSMFIDVNSRVRSSAMGQIKSPCPTALVNILRP
jgi:hypothetical protein